MTTEITYNDYFWDDTCGDPTTNRRLVACNTESLGGDDFCPCPPRPAVLYFTDLNEVVYVGDFNMLQVYDAGVARITNNTPYTVCNFTFTVPDFGYVLIVPGTDVEIASGETADFHLYIPRDLEERLREEAQTPEDVPLSPVNFAVKLTEPKGDDGLTVSAHNNSTEESFAGNTKRYVFLENKSIIEFENSREINVGDLMAAIQIGAHENIDWTILTEKER